jgi:DNA polymerase-4
MQRAIIHINVADFAVAVERLADRRLNEHSVIIAPEGAPRATVYDMSEEAYREGVRKGMPLRRAVRICRRARVLPPHPARYEQAMGDLLRQALPFSPLIEPGKDDGHLFVDVTGTSRLFGPAVDVAWRLRRQAVKSLGLAPIWSLAANKLVAKVASRLVKPLGECIVTPGDEAAFLAPLPIRLIPGIEKPDLDRLGDFNLTHVYQAAALDRAQLDIGFGRRAGFLADALRGIDTAPVLPVGQRPPGVVFDHTLDSDSNEPWRIDGILRMLADRAGFDLRRQGRVARRAAVCVDYSDGKRCIRQARIHPATANDMALLAFARRALGSAWRRRVRIRHLRLVCDHLAYPPTQMPLFEDDRRTSRRQDRVVAALDRIRKRFGAGSVRTGSAAYRMSK